MKTTLLLVCCFVALVGFVVAASDEPTPIGSSHSGAVTWYGATGAGACSYSTNDFDSSHLLVAAASDFQNSKVCGTCVKVWSTKTGKSVTFKIVDQCPGCGSTYNFDLSQYAFSQLDDPQNGFNTACWNYVACPTSGNLEYRTKEGSNEWWFVVMVYNSKIPVSKFEIKEANSNTWLSLSLNAYNYYDASVLGHKVSLPVSVRVTAVNGQVITDNNVITSIPAEGKAFQSSSQFSDSNISGSITCSGGGSGGGGSTTGGGGGTAEPCKKLKSKTTCGARTDCLWKKKKCRNA